MIYQIINLELSEAYRNDPLWADAVEWLPDGSAIQVCEINKALSGSEYRYYPDGQTMPETMIPCAPDVYAHYHNTHRHYQKFGLYHGGGENNELPWYPDFVAYFDDLKSIVEGWRIRKAHEAARHK